MVTPVTVNIPDETLAHYRKVVDDSGPETLLTMVENHLLLVQKP